MKMDSIFRIVTWNCRKAASSSGLWKYFLEIEPDVALLQEVNNIPNEVRSIYTYQMYKAAKRDGSPQRFNTAILVKGHISNKIFLPAPSVWIKEELQRFSGNLVALEILPDNGPPIKAVSVHGHDKAIDSTRFMEIDITGVRLTQNP